MGCGLKRNPTAYSVPVDMSCYERLANAIVVQAVKDYKGELRKLIKNPHNREAMGKAMDLEHFFHSQWYGMLTNLDPDCLLHGVREMVREEADRQRRCRLERLRREAAKGMAKSDRHSPDGSGRPIV